MPVSVLANVSATVSVAFAPRGALRGSTSAIALEAWSAHSSLDKEGSPPQPGGRPGSGERFTLAPAQPIVRQAYHNTSMWSWGGGVVHWPGKGAKGSKESEEGDGLFYLFGSGMTNGCGLHAWSSNTLVFHATSVTVEGPYTFSDVALPVLATAPGPARAPDGTFLLFSMGDGNDTLAVP